MANMRFTLVATAGTVIHNAPDITAPQETLLLNWLWAYYAPVDALGSPLTRNSTNEAQAFRNYATSLWAGTRANVIRWKHELDRAAVPAPTLPQ